MSIENKVPMSDFTEVTDIADTARIIGLQDNENVKYPLQTVISKTLETVNERVLLKDDINIEGGVTGFNPIGEVKQGDNRAVGGAQVYNFIESGMRDIKTLELAQVTANSVVTSIGRMSSNDVTIAVKFTKVTTKVLDISVRSYDDLTQPLTAKSVISTKNVFKKQWSWGDPTTIIVDAKVDTSNVAIQIDGEDIIVESVTILSGVGKQIDTVKESYSFQKNLFNDLQGNDIKNTNAVFLSDLIKSKKDKINILISNKKDFGVFSVEIIYSNGEINSASFRETIYEGKGSINGVEFLSIPVVLKSKNYRIRISNASGELFFKSISIMEIDNNLGEKPEPTIKKPETTIQKVTIEKKPIVNNGFKVISINNNSSTSNIYIENNGVTYEFEPLSNYNISVVGASNIWCDRGIVNCKITFSDEFLQKEKQGVETTHEVNNYRGYTILRPFPLADNAVWATKTNDNELWQIEFDKIDPTIIVKETLLQTFEYPIVDLFVTEKLSIIISTGDIYSTIQQPVTRFKLFRSDFATGQWGKNVTEITSIDAKSLWIPKMGISQFGGGAIVFGEYTISNEKVGVYRSTDDGITWNEVLRLDSPSEVRHIHLISVNRDNQSEAIAATGDAGSQIKWYKSTDKGATWVDLNVPTTYYFKILGLDFNGNTITVVTDSPGYANYIIQFKNEDFENPIFRRRTDQVYFGMTRVDNALYVWNVTQHSAMTGNQRQSYQTELVCSKDNGVTWEVVWSWESTSASANFGFRYGSLPDRKGVIYLRTDRAGLVGHFVPQNSISIKLK